MTPYAGGSESFVDKWEHLRSYVPRGAGRQYFGVGYGADANGFGSQGARATERRSNPLGYPFNSVRRPA